MLQYLSPIKNKIQFITFSDEMGENELISEGFKPKIIGQITSGKTSAADTKKAVQVLKESSVQLIVFVGGDGTAQDVLSIIGQEFPVLGCPSGVKIHSSCFGVNPEACARIIMRFLWDELPLRNAEVIDVNEEAFRNNQLIVELKGYLLVPYEPYLLQGGKMTSPLTIDEHDNQKMIANYIIENMESDTYYILGPGTTVEAIADVLGFKKTLLGVDICYNKKLVGTDLNEAQILDLITNKKAKIVVSPIGNQGFILGRGSLQISPKVIQEVGQGNIIVIATRYKLSTFLGGYLRVDTRDKDLDKSFLDSFIRVIVDYNEIRIVKIK